jgi:parallel beta-helix repeat protein
VPGLGRAHKDATMNRTAFARTLSIFTLLSCSAGLAAGPLTPAAGPVAPTMKTMTEVEPRTAVNAANTPGDADSLFKITQPGSYYLTGNITGVSGKHGIEIASSNVTLDLGGFKLAGVAGSLTGITVSLTDASETTILNGSVRGWSQNGIDTVTANAVRTTVKGVNCSDNGWNGLSLFRYGRAIDCNCDTNGQSGFDSYNYCTLSHCEAGENGASGIDAAGSTVISECVCNNNGVDGIEARAGSTVSGCVASSNHASGINAHGQCLVSGNNCYLNLFAGAGAGILVSGSDNRVEGNTCTGNFQGVHAATGGNIIVKNTCAGNTVNWQLAVNNVYGPIIDRSAPASPVVSGNSAASTLGSTDPNANFTF